MSVKRPRIAYKHNDRSTEKALSETSEMKKPRRKISRLAKDATDDEIIRWTKSNDVFDRLEAGVSEIIEDHADLDAVLHEAIFQDNTAQLNMRLSPGHEGGAEQASARAHDRCHDTCSYLAGRAFGTGIKSRIAIVKRMQERPTVKKLLAYEKKLNEGFPKTARQPSRSAR
jgi:hypothetical protein